MYAKTAETVRIREAVIVRFPYNTVHDFVKTLYFCAKNSIDKAFEI